MPMGSEADQYHHCKLMPSYGASVLYLGIYHPIFKRYFLPPTLVNFPVFDVYDH